MKLVYFIIFLILLSGQLFPDAPGSGDWEFGIGGSYFLPGNRDIAELAGVLNGCLKKVYDSTLTNSVITGNSIPVTMSKLSYPFLGINGFAQYPAYQNRWIALSLRLDMAYYLFNSGKVSCQALLFNADYSLSFNLLYWSLGCVARLFPNSPVSLKFGAGFAMSEWDIESGGDLSGGIFNNSVRLVNYSVSDMFYGPSVIAGVLFSLANSSRSSISIEADYNFAALFASNGDYWFYHAVSVDFVLGVNLFRQ